MLISVIVTTFKIVLLILSIRNSKSLRAACKTSAFCLFECSIVLECSFVLQCSAALRGRGEDADQFVVSTALRVQLFSPARVMHLGSIFACTVSSSRSRCVNGLKLTVGSSSKIFISTLFIQFVGSFRYTMMIISYTYSFHINITHKYVINEIFLQLSLILISRIYNTLFCYLFTYSMNSYSICLIELHFSYCLDVNNGV